MSEDRLLPKFDEPPVSEVVFSVLFQPVTDLTPVHLGEWWEMGDNRERYPVCEVRPPAEPNIEEFGPTGGAMFSISLRQGGPSPASWFFSKDRTELVQIQQDRFTRNWTRGDSQASYPSYERLVPQFASDFNTFRTFLTSRGLTATPSVQCELVYINPITPDAIWERPGQLDRVLAPWAGTYSEGFLEEPEDVQISTRYVMRQNDAPIGRLTYTVQPVRQADGTPVLLMQVGARGRPLGEGVEGVMGFMDLAHEWITRAFATLTTPEMHQLWRRTR